MWRSRIDFQRGVLDDLGREHGRRADRHDLVVVAVDDERRRLELLEIFSLVRFGERLNTIVDGVEAGQHPLKPKRVPQSLRDLRPGAVGAVERRAEILEELRAVGEDAGADAVEYLDRQAAG